MTKGNLGEILSKLEKDMRELQTRRRASDLAFQREANRGNATTTADGPGTRPKSRRNNRGRSSSSVIEQSQLSLFELERAGRFTKHPITAQSEYPTFLTRLPIFVPGRRSNQRQLLDAENAIPFKTPWGEGRKHGPPLTVYDEDTLIAIGHLRQNLLIGRPNNLPMPVSELYKTRGEENVHVHVVHCMLSDIQNVCGTSQGGKNNRLRLDSIKRLSSTTIEFNTKTAEKFVGRGTVIKLIDVAWQTYEDNAILFIQFSPVMAAWFEREYTYLNWELRKKLSDTGKALHRFFSSQPKQYEIFTKKLMYTIGYMREYKKFMADLRGTLDRLQIEQWVTNFKIVGSGRRKPHKLVLNRR